MADNPQEQTEAKLLAYIDGELDDLGRAEIERHIESNPKHRKLLDELSTGRRLVRSLPREVAPAELFENVQSQLERQELLSSVAEVNPDNGTIRLSGWGQARAAAAVLLLATGLGIIVYNVLPKRTVNHFAVQSSTKPTLGAETARLRDESASTASARDRGVGPERLGTKELNAVTPVVGAVAPDTAGIDALRHTRMASAADAAGNLPAVREALAAVGVLSESAALEAGLDAAPANGIGEGVAKVAGVGRGGGMPPVAKNEGINNAVGREPVYLVIASSDLSAAHRDIVTKLAQTGLPYRQVPVTPISDPTPPADARTQQQGQQPAISPASSLSGQQALSLPTSPPPMENVLVVRQVPRSRAAELVAAFNQPAVNRYAMTYVPKPGDALGARDKLARRSLNSAVADARGGASFNRGDRDGRNTKQFDPPVTSSTEPSQTAGVAQKMAVGTPTARTPVAAAAASGPVAIGSRSSSRPAVAADRFREPPRTASPAAATKPQTPAPAMAKDAALAKDAAVGGMAGGAPAADAPHLTRPIQANDSVELVYFDIRRNNRPVAQPMRVSPRGTIYVAGFGEFVLTGLLPAEATSKLTSAVQAKSPASKGVEVRLLAEPAAPAVAAPQPMQQEQMPRPATPESGALADASQAQTSSPPTKPAQVPIGSVGGRGSRSSAPTASTAPSGAKVQLAPIEPAPSATPAPAQVPASVPAPAVAESEELVDLVIVLQRDAASADGR